ncbi:MAG: hypothetical protein BGP08_06035 [Rhizobiales bacterium 64-17]|nr:MAG: hypothetical protein BGP08_06035 [Rhizobiales bacterium 64-17]
MAGLVPAIHDFVSMKMKEVVDARNKSAHDVEREAPLSLRLILRSRAERGVSKDVAAPVPQPPMVRDARLCRAPHHEGYVAS